MKENLPGLSFAAFLSMRARMAASLSFRPPLVSGTEVQIVELVKILEASSQSLKQGGAPIVLQSPTSNGNGNGDTAHRRKNSMQVAAAKAAKARIG